MEPNNKLRRTPRVSRLKDKPLTDDGEEGLRSTHSKDKDEDEDIVYQEDIESLQQRLREKDAALDDLRQSLTNATRQLLAFSKAADTFKLDDQHFLKSLDALIYKVINWTTLNFCSRLPKKAAAFPKLSRIGIFDELLPEWKELLQDQNMRPLLIQMFLWTRLYDRVFTTSVKTGGLWAGNMRDPFLRLNDRLYPRSRNPKLMREYHHWRSQTARIIHDERDVPTPRPTPDIINTIFGETLQQLKPFSANNERPGFIEGLVDIFKHAIELDCEMKKQVAEYFLFWQHSRPAETDPGKSTTGHRHNDRGKLMNSNPDLVLLILEPGLRKRGDSDGSGYDQEYVLRECKTFPIRIESPSRDRRR